MSRPMIPRARTRRIGFAVFLALLSAGLIALYLGAQMLGRGAWLPVSAMLFTLGWALWAIRSGHRRVWIAMLWVVGVHVALWLPFLTSSYLGGQGMARIDYAVIAALFTSLAVAWYIAQEHLWHTALIGIALVGLIAGCRRFASTQRGESQ